MFLWVPTEKKNLENWTLFGLGGGQTLFLRVPLGKPSLLTNVNKKMVFFIEGFPKHSVLNVKALSTRRRPE